MKPYNMSSLGQIPWPSHSYEQFYIRPEGYHLHLKYEHSHLFPWRLWRAWSSPNIRQVFVESLRRALHRSAGHCNTCSQWLESLGLFRAFPPEPLVDMAAAAWDWALAAALQIHQQCTVAAHMIKDLNGIPEVTIFAMAIHHAWIEPGVTIIESFLVTICIENLWLYGNTGHAWGHSFASYNEQKGEKSFVELFE